MGARQRRLHAYPHPGIGCCARPLPRLRKVALTERATPGRIRTPNHWIRRSLRERLGAVSTAPSATVRYPRLQAAATGAARDVCPGGTGWHRTSRAWPWRRSPSPFGSRAPFRSGCAGCARGAGPSLSGASTRARALCRGLLGGDRARWLDRPKGSPRLAHTRQRCIASRSH